MPARSAAGYGNGPPPGKRLVDGDLAREHQQDGAQRQRDVGVAQRARPAAAEQQTAERDDQEGERERARERGRERGGHEQPGPPALRREQRQQAEGRAERERVLTGGQQRRRREREEQRRPARRASPLVHHDDREEPRRGRRREHRDRDHAEHGGQRVEEQAVVDDAVATGVPVVVPGRPAVDAEDARLVAVRRIVHAAEARQADREADQAGHRDRDQHPAIDARQPRPVKRELSGGNGRGGGRHRDSRRTRPHWAAPICGHYQGAPCGRSRYSAGREAAPTCARTATDGSSAIATLPCTSSLQLGAHQLAPPAREQRVLVVPVRHRLDEALELRARGHELGSDVGALAARAHEHGAERGGRGDPAGEARRQLARTLHGLRLRRARERVEQPLRGRRREAAETAQLAERRGIGGAAAVAGPQADTSRLNAPGTPTVASSATTAGAVTVTFTGSSGTAPASYSATACTNAGMTTGCVTQGSYTSGAQARPGWSRARRTHAKVTAVPPAGYASNSSATSGSSALATTQLAAPANPTLGYGSTAGSINVVSTSSNAPGGQTYTVKACTNAA